MPACRAWCVPFGSPGPKKDAISAARKAPVILITNPNPWSRDLLDRLVLGMRCGVRLVLCGDGGEALTHCRHWRFALILTGLNLPQVDGFELLHEARLRRSVAKQPFILTSDHTDQVSVRVAVALAPTAYLVKSSQTENLVQRLRGLLLRGGKVVTCPLPKWDAGENLGAFLGRARDSAEGTPLLADVHAANGRCLSAKEHPLRVLEGEFGRDPQITADLIAAANSATQHIGPACQTLGQALRRLGLGHSLNLMLGFSLQRAIQFGEPLLVERIIHFWDPSQHCADTAWELTDTLGANVERCYATGLLHHLDDLALLRTLQDQYDGGGALDETRLDKLLGRFGASLDSVLRAHWRLPLELRRLIAATYQFGDVLSHEELILGLTTQAASLPEDGAEQLTESKATHMLGLDGERLTRLLRP